MLPVVLVADGIAGAGENVQQPVSHQPEPAVVARAQLRRGLHDLVEHGLQALRTRDRAQHVADRALLRAEALDFVRAHDARSRGAIVSPKALSFSQ
jgi:hypothetical protein